MKPPYFQVTARCDNDRCQTGQFTTARKKIVHIGTSGKPYTIERLVCPQCKAWGYITNVEEVKA